MSREDALKLIEQALNVATSKGAFNMDDIVMIVKALEVIKEPIEQATHTTSSQKW